MKSDTEINSIVGLTFNLLKVLKFQGKGKQGHFLYLCQCVCGNTTVVPNGKLVSGHTKSCGCWNTKSIILRNIKRKGQFRKDPVDYAFRIIKASYVQSAQKRQLEFSLTDEQLGVLIDKACHYCGGGFHTKVEVKHQNCVISYNGIDRVDNKIGYIPSNCVACCSLCNQAKHTMSYQEFMTWIRKVYLHTFSKKVGKNDA